jgi:S-DNA-T family DNA segregation ATPase FtsK/SpoIIIE
MNPLRFYRQRIEAVMSMCVPKSKPKGQLATPWTFVDGKVQDGIVYRYMYKCPPNYSALDLEEQYDTLFAACGAHVEIADRAGIAIIEVYPVDFPQIIPFDKRIQDYIKKLRGLKVLLGFDRMGRPILHDFDSLPHLLIGSLPGYGKSTLIRLLIYQLLLQLPMNEVQIIILDFKQYSFMPFAEMPNVHVAKTIEEAAKAVDVIFNEMNRRAHIVLEKQNREAMARFPHVFLFIDEGVQISPKLVTKDERELANFIDRYIARISCLSREAKIHEVYCTQRPDSDAVNSQLRSMMTAFVGFRTNDIHSSRVIIKEGGLEKLPANRKGRAIYSTDKKTMIQVPYVIDDDYPDPKARKETKEDSAWRKLLYPIKNGVKAFEYFLQNRDAHTEKRIETDLLSDVIADTAYYDRAGRASDWGESGQPGETGIRDIKGTGKRKDYRGSEPGDRKIKDVAFDENGPINLGPTGDDETDELE